MAYRKPRFSVMRIEQAKQRMLAGQCYQAAKSKSKYLMDWTADDEDALYKLLEQWDRATGLSGLCDLLDDHQFSAGTLNQHLGNPQGVRGTGRPLNAEDLRKQA